MVAKLCKNTTCTRPSRTAYCDRLCQTTARNADQSRHVMDVRLGMDQWREVSRLAASDNLSVAEWILNLIDAAT